MNWFPRVLLRWFDDHGRTHLPWQQDRTPYRVWVSEIMLQQTQVATVIDYYERFMTRFPDVAALANAPIDDVLALWTGLGYYARGRNLHKAAQQVIREHNGEFPVGVEALTALPGIGRSTAGAIAAIAQGERAAILDGNVKRVLARFHAVDGYPGQAAVSKRLWHFAGYHTPTHRIPEYTQAIMDLGATCCASRNPACDRCPLAARCEARALDRVSDFPGRKPRKDKPVRRALVWLLINEQGQCLLQRRPAPGLWGGLWTPPQTELDAASSGEVDPTIALTELLAALQLAGAITDKPQALPPFRHTFTHFHLDLQPFRAILKRPRGASQVAEQDDWHWQDLDLTPDRGLSRPALKLLDALRDSPDRLPFD